MVPESSLPAPTAPAGFPTPEPPLAPAGSVPAGSAQPQTGARKLAELRLAQVPDLSGTVILPVGSTEQHGHLPYATDAIIAEGVAVRVAEELGALVLPTISYGYRSRTSSGGGPLFPGTIDLSGATLTALVRDIVEEAIRDGATQVVVLSAHFENDAFIQEALELVSLGLGPNSGVELIATNWWDPLPQEVIDRVFEGLLFPGWELEHAGVTETSLLLALRPDLVDPATIEASEVDRAPLSYFRLPARVTDAPACGNLSSARGSTAERGQIILDAAVAGIVNLCRK